MSPERFRLTIKGRIKQFRTSDDLAMVQKKINSLRAKLGILLRK